MPGVPPIASLVRRNETFDLGLYSIQMQNIVDYGAVYLHDAPPEPTRRDRVARLQEICGINVPDDEAEPARRQI
jgi:hypothetical protein